MNVPAVGSVLAYHYDTTLVALSFVISVLGSYVALELAASAARQRESYYGPAFALGGCAIWSMHFIAMAAYNTPLYVSYALLPTAASLIISIVVAGIGLAVASRDPGRIKNLLLGGFVIGLGVVAMHYIGMAAMDLRATFEWNMNYVGASVLIAVVAATVALWLAFNVRSTAQRLIAAVVMGIAVCTMHYTGMAAATMVCVASAPRSDLRIEGSYLGYLVFAIAILSLFASIAYNRFNVVAQMPAAALRSKA